MNQSYELTIRDALECCSSPLGLHEPDDSAAPYGSPYGREAAVDPRALQLPAPPAYKPPARFVYNPQDPPSAYSPLRRLQDLTSMVSHPNLALPAKDLPARRGDVRTPGADFRCAVSHASPVLSGGAAGIRLAGQDLGRGACFAPPSPDYSLEFSSPVPNGYLHFESTLFENGERRDEEEEGGTAHFKQGPKSAGGRSGSDRSSFRVACAVDAQERSAPNRTARDGAELSVPKQRSAYPGGGAGLLGASEEDVKAPPFGKSPSGFQNGVPNPSQRAAGPRDNSPDDRQTNTVSVRQHL